MTSDHHITSDLIHDILDALERHGHARSDDQQTGWAIGLIGDLAGIYEGTQDHPENTARPVDPGLLPGGRRSGPSSEPRSLHADKTPVTSRLQFLPPSGTCRCDGGGAVGSVAAWRDRRLSVRLQGGRPRPRSSSQQDNSAQLTRIFAGHWT
jgi:hypothetical protein